MRNFISELKRAFGLPWIFAVVVMWIPMIVANIEPISQAMFSEQISMHMTNVVVNAINKSAVLPVSLFALTCPYACSFISDQSSGYIKYQIARTGRVQYAMCRFLANAIAAAIAVFFAQIVFVLFCSICFLLADVPYYSTYVLTDFYKENLQVVMEDVFRSKPILYYLALFGLQTFSSMAWASFALALSGYVRNRYITLCIPFLTYSLVAACTSSSNIFASIYSAMWTIYSGNLLASMWPARLSSYLLFFAVMLAISFGLFWRKVKQYDGA